MPPTPDALPSAPLLVACLCAEWCGTCRDYRETFRQLAARFEGLQFTWIDIEDEAELVDPIDVEDFPTLLIARPDGAPLFFGPLTPQPETLARLLQAHTGPGASPNPLSRPDLFALAGRISASRP
jgi:thioredoxin 1